MPVKITIDKTSLDLALKRLGSVPGSVRSSAYNASRNAGKFLRQQVIESLSADDHSLDDLADMDHPYARRHGGLRLSHPDRGGMIRDGRHTVHSQTGRLSRSVRTANDRITTLTGGPGFRLWVDLAAAPYFRAIVEGSSTMLPRDPLWETATGPGTKSRMFQIISGDMSRDPRLFVK